MGQAESSPRSVVISNDGSRLNEQAKPPCFWLEDVRKWIMDSPVHTTFDDDDDSWMHQDTAILERFAFGPPPPPPTNSPFLGGQPIHEDSPSSLATVVFTKVPHVVVETDEENQAPPVIILASPSKNQKKKRRKTQNKKGSKLDIRTPFYSPTLKERFFPHHGNVM